jgi:hypothetical protein
MAAETVNRHRFNWWLPLYTSVGTIIVFLPLLFSTNFGYELSYLFIGVPIISLGLLTTVLSRTGHGRLTALSMLVVYWAITWTLFKSTNVISSEIVRTEGRWLFHSKVYKAVIMARPSPANGELKHIEWDGWGGFGAGDTTVYLVFDPSDSLSAPAKIGALGKFNGIPCPVARIHRIESHWYTVLFYTDTDWEHCS